jgi:hypothetical protein
MVIKLVPPASARGLVTASLALLTTLALAAPAAAQSVALAPPADPVEDVSFLVTATGVGIKDYNVYGTIKPVGAVGCGPTYETDADGDDFMYSVDAEGAYSVADDAKVDQPGQYLLCAWLQEYASDSVAAAATSATVNVRSAQATLAITGPTHLRVGTTANFTFTGTTELGRQVVAHVKRDGGRPCGASANVDDGDSFMSGENVQGNYSVLDAPWKYEIDDRGTYRICAWIQESWSDATAEAAATFTFTVGTPAGCSTARSRVNRARGRGRWATRLGPRATVRSARGVLARAKRAARRAC